MYLSLSIDRLSCPLISYGYGSKETIHLRLDGNKYSYIYPQDMDSRILSADIEPFQEHNQGKKFSSLVKSDVVLYRLDPDNQYALLNTGIAVEGSVLVTSHDRHGRTFASWKSCMIEPATEDNPYRDLGPYTIHDQIKRDIGQLDEFPYIKEIFEQADIVNRTRKGLANVIISVRKELETLLNYDFEKWSVFGNDSTSWFIFRDGDNITACDHITLRKTMIDKLKDAPWLMIFNVSFNGIQLHINSSKFENDMEILNLLLPNFKKVEITKSKYIDLLKELTGTDNYVQANTRALLSLGIEGVHEKTLMFSENNVLLHAGDLRGMTIEQILVYHALEVLDDKDLEQLGEGINNYVREMSRNGSDFF